MSGDSGEGFGVREGVGGAWETGFITKNSTLFLKNSNTFRLGDRVHFPGRDGLPPDHPQRAGLPCAQGGEGEGAKERADGGVGTTQR